MDTSETTPGTVKFFIYLGSDDAIDADGGLGRRQRAQTIYFDAPAEARRAIRELPPSQRRIATVERAEF